MTAFVWFPVSVSLSDIGWERRSRAFWLLVVPLALFPEHGQSAGVGFYLLFIIITGLTLLALTGFFD